MSRWVYLLGLGLALVALGLAVTEWALALRGDVTEANCRLIRPGMTLGEARALLGNPPLEGQPVARLRDLVLYVWGGLDGEVLILVAPDGSVFAHAWFGNKDRRWTAPPKTTAILSRLRAWLGW